MRIVNHANLSFEVMGIHNMRVVGPPTKRISAYNLGKKERDGLLEQVIIVRILYDDGTVWQAH